MVAAAVASAKRVPAKNGGKAAKAAYGAAKSPERALAYGSRGRARLID